MKFLQCGIASPRTIWWNLWRASLKDQLNFWKECLIIEASVSFLGRTKTLETRSYLKNQLTMLCPFPVQKRYKSNKNKSRIGRSSKMNKTVKNLHKSHKPNKISWRFKVKIDLPRLETNVFKNRKGLQDVHQRLNMKRWSS